MALVRVAQYGSVPGPVTDYQAQNAHLQAFTNQLLTQQFILDSGTAQPAIKQGCYVSHGGSLYVADADTAITGSPSDGSVYIRVSGSTSLTVEFVTDISGYAWNPVYTALTSGSYTLLPYLIVKAGTVWTRYNFNPNNQQFGSLASLAVTGNATVGGTLGVTSNITVGGTVDGHDIDSELDTLNGRVNQGVKTTDSPTFANATISGHNIDSELDTLNSRVNQAVNTTSSPTFVSVNTGQGATEVHLMNQNLRTTDNVSFANLNPPVDNTDISPPSIGKGGFTYAVAPIEGNISLPVGGTYIVISMASSIIQGHSCGRFSGGTSLSNNSNDDTMDVFIWRIA